MLIQNFSELTEELLRAVCGEAWSESMTLEFKRKLPDGSDREKQELLKDIAAFANSDGGDLVYGVSERDGKADSPTPITGEPADAAMRRLSQTIEAGIEPRVPGLRMAHIPFDQGYMLVIRVPASFLGPHSIRVNNARRFVMRTGTNVSDLSFEQLRGAFDRTATLGEQAHRFVQQRIAAILERNTPRPLASGPLCAIHFLPLSGLAGKQTPDLQELHRQGFTRLNDVRAWPGCSRTFNLDGLAIHPPRSEEGDFGYAQIFRNGALEAVTIAGREFQPSLDADKSYYVWSAELTKFARERASTFLAISKDEGFSGPAIVSLSLLNVGGYELEIGGPFAGYKKMVPDRSQLIPPEAWIEHLESADPDAIVRPLLDTLWQGFGAERCLDYKEDTGEYKPRR